MILTISLKKTNKNKTNKMFLEIPKRLLIAIPSPRNSNIVHEIYSKSDKIKPRSNHDSNQKVEK